MGGCVSSPKDLALNEGEEAPVESPNTPKNAEGETVAQEGGEIESEEKEEPLVDLSEPKEKNVEEEAEAAAETNEEDKPEEAQAEQAKAEDKNDEPLVTL